MTADPRESKGLLTAFLAVDEGPILVDSCTFFGQSEARHSEYTPLSAPPTLDIHRWLQALDKDPKLRILIDLVSKSIAPRATPKVGYISAGLATVP